VSNLRLLALQKAMKWVDQNPEAFKAMEALANNPAVVENADNFGPEMMMQMLKNSPELQKMAMDSAEAYSYSDLQRMVMESAEKYSAGARGVDPENTFDMPQTNMPLTEMAKPNRMTNAVKWMLTNPLGEEITEGTIGGLMAGAGMLASDQSGERTALQTASAIAGGIGMGMLGRRAGEAIGRRLAPKPLSDQMGLIATIARSGGSETTAKGLEQQAKASSLAIQDALRRSKRMEISREAGEFGQRGALPGNVFREKYGVTPEEFLQYQKIDQILGDSSAEEMVKRINDFGAQIEEGASLYSDTKETADLAKKVAGRIKDITSGDLLEPVTGKQVGKAIGRFIGDEVGVIGGLMAGGVAANQLGFKTDKDRRIDKLQELLSQHGIKY
jgi:hypothetical protein